MPPQEIVSVEVTHWGKLRTSSMSQLHLISPRWDGPSARAMSSVLGEVQPGGRLAHDRGVGIISKSGRSSLVPRTDVVSNPV